MKNNINQESADKLEALIKKGQALPYKKLAKEFVNTVIEPNTYRKLTFNKCVSQSSKEFATYLENRKVAIPVKIDAIDFLFQSKDKDVEALLWSFMTSLAFISFIQERYLPSSDDALDDIEFYREIETIEGSLIKSDKVVFLNSKEDA